jgi:rod shape-determining protein MreC
MFSKKMVLTVGVIVLIAVNVIVLSITSRRSRALGIERLAITVVAPFQEIVTRTVRFTQNIWRSYFYLVNVSGENQILKRRLNQAIAENNQWRELELANTRLRNLLNFQKAITGKVVAAQVVGKDPSIWFKAVIIDKGKTDGVDEGFPVVMPQGIAGQVVEVSNHYAKVMLIIDRNSAVDALVQRSRARGVIKGESTDKCRLDYVLHKNDVRRGDTVVSSGLDGVYPKGLLIGQVSDIIDSTSDIFQEVTITPFIDFEKLEEVLVILDLTNPDFTSRR